MVSDRLARLWLTRRLPRVGWRELIISPVGQELPVRGYIGLQLPGHGEVLRRLPGNAQGSGLQPAPSLKLIVAMVL